MAHLAKFSPRGQYAVVVDETSVHLINARTGQETLQLVMAGVSSVEFSPQDTYLLSCEKFVGGAAGGKRNLLVWSSFSGKEVAGFEFKKASREGARSIRFTNSEHFCARQAAPHSIEIFSLKGSGFEQASCRIEASLELFYGNKAAEHGREEVKFDGFEW
eukprot:CAMPEP_0202956514 /NCGR_PEP_ID=MMETSP1396-20130829/1022_1 /ASSEMBLY_ACC=CAM_ASM_000872 /TAXON_ID= /ORGANISM="Pseudokeronopsis sp., Strain Brazil" /LENGTH=159 /DNA_ID=CAMNT_0049673573 /DNA_START=172 /DNA_END=648 /DNA_ORIENTATION=-